VTSNYMHNQTLKLYCDLRHCRHWRSDLLIDYNVIDATIGSSNGAIFRDTAGPIYPV
jgi:hypothetical protein